MNSEFRDKWHRVYETFAGHLRPWAKVIRDHGQPDYQLLGHLFDFGQLCVLFPALLVLARAFHDEPFRRLFFRSADPSDLERASFGKWQGFLRDALKRLRQHGAELPFPGILTPVLVLISISLSRTTRVMSLASPPVFEMVMVTFTWSP